MTSKAKRPGQSQCAACGGRPKYGAQRPTVLGQQPKKPKPVFIPFSELGIAYSDSLLVGEYKDLGRPVIKQ